MRAVHILGLVILFIVMVFGGWVAGAIYLAVVGSAYYILDTIERRGVNGKRKKGIR